MPYRRLTEPAAALAEREMLVSGAIERFAGNTPGPADPNYRRYGVLFTTRAGHSADDYGDDPSRLLDNLIEYPAADPTLPSRYFTIIGGYYTEKTANGQTIIDKVFGVANTLDFEITDGGAKTIGSHWQLSLDSKPGDWDQKHPNENWGNAFIRRAYLNEFEKALPNRPASMGWTFIINETPTADDIPTSGMPLYLAALCPEILEIQATEVESTDESVTWSFNALTADGEPQQWLWQWGDGSADGPSENPVQHVFMRGTAELSYTVGLDISSPNGCSGFSSIEIHIPAACPVLQEIQVNAGRVSKTKKAFRFNAPVTGPAPDKWIWNLGEETIETTVAELNHDFTRPPGDDVQLSVKVRALGPGACTGAELEVNITVPGICPVLTGLIAVGAAPGKTEQEYTFTAEYTGPAPTSFNWNFGDESTQSSEASITRGFARLPGDARDIAVSVTASGPGACDAGLAETSVKIPGICPVLTGLRAEAAILGETEQEYTFSAEYTGPAPTSFTWTFGDESAQSSEASITRSFARLPGDARDIAVSVTASGPGACDAGLAETSVQIPGICPVLTGLRAEAAILGETEQEFTFTAEYTGPAPTSFNWNFGDESAQSSEASITRSFARLPGDARDIAVSVTASGPGACDAGLAETSVQIPGICPVLTGLRAEGASPGDTEQEFTFTAEYTGPKPTSFNWTFGDESTQSSEASITRSFARLPGDARDIIVSVTASGPGACDAGLSETSVKIPGICPVLTGLRAEAATIGETEQEYTFTAEYTGPKPTSFNWTFGDESAQSSEASITRSFLRLPGDARDIIVSVTASGPGACDAGLSETSVKIPGICPVLDALETTVLETGESTIRVQFRAVWRKTEPALYRWNWGDGSPEETTTAALAEHSFTRPLGNPQELTVSVNASGPGACSAQASGRISVPGICPEIESLVLSATGQRDREFDIEAQLQMRLGEAAQYTWNWGDGSAPQSSTEPNASHTYVRLPGDARSLSVSVRAEGPGPCVSLAEANILVPGFCPEIEDLVLQVFPPSAQQQQLSAALQMSVAAEGYSWDWGDGSAPEKTRQPFATHTYARLPGDAVAYNLRVTAEGPGACSAEREAEIRIAGICPEIESLQAALLTSADEALTFAFHANILHAVPTLYRWDWGDGTAPEESTVPQASHAFARIPGSDSSYTVRLSATGPGACSAFAMVQVQTPKICPVVADFDIEYEPIAPTQQGIRVRIELDKTQPSELIWEWGDGQTERTSVPEATHAYTRQPGDARQYRFKARIIGPGDCECQVQGQVNIEGICPQILGIDSELVAGSNHEEQLLRVSAEVDYPDGLRYLWNWDDGTQTETTRPETTHLYRRYAGDARDYTLSLTLLGPGACRCLMAVKVLIPGFCPELRQAQVLAGELKDESLETSILLAIDKALPDQIEWNWDDGSPAILTDGNTHSLSHTYTRLPGDARTYNPVITLRGPGQQCESRQELEIQVPGVCPELAAIRIDRREAISDTEEKIWFSLEVLRAQAERYIWNWNDGEASETTTVPLHSHVYRRLPGDARSLELIVQLEGPGRCAAQGTIELEIQGLCPLIAGFSLADDSLTENEYAVTLEVQQALTHAEEIEWEWGDGSAPESTVSGVNSHHYLRHPGDDLQYKAVVRLKGPGSCEAVASYPLTVPGICPEIVGEKIEMPGQSIEWQEVRIELDVKKAMPTLFRWNWGDGSPEEQSSGPVLSHNYARFAGDDRPYTVVVTCEGPGTSGKCVLEHKIPLTIPGYCPLPAGIVIAAESTEEKSKWIEFQAKTEYAPAQQYIWNWGDGTPAESTNLPLASHRYERWPGAARSMAVTVELLGPDSCASSDTLEILIPGLCPKVLGASLVSIDRTTETESVRAALSLEDADKLNNLDISYHWNWGDGNESTTTAPEAIHLYQRPAGDTVYKVSYTVEGPGECRSEGCRRIRIFGTCPVVEEVIASYCDIRANEAVLVFHARLCTEPAPKNLPTRYTWQWGDGSPDSITTQPWASHAYVRGSEAGVKTLRLWIEDDCNCRSAFEREVEIPGDCPMAAAIKVIYGVQTATEQELTLYAVVKGHGAERYRWTAGDGSAPVETREPTFKHRYARTQAAYKVSVQVIGSKSCRHEAAQIIEVALANEDMAPA